MSRLLGLCSKRQSLKAHSWPQDVSLKTLTTLAYDDGSLGLYCCDLFCKATNSRLNLLSATAQHALWFRRHSDLPVPRTAFSVVLTLPQGSALLSSAACLRVGRSGYGTSACATNRSSAGAHSHCFRPANLSGSLVRRLSPFDPNTLWTFKASLPLTRANTSSSSSAATSPKTEQLHHSNHRLSGLFRGHAAEAGSLQRTPTAQGRGRESDLSFENALRVGTLYCAEASSG